MPAARQLEDLQVWQLACELRDGIKTVVQPCLSMHDKNLQDQLARAARSVPANIAEGFGHFSSRQFARYLRIARASAMETRNHLLEAKRILPGLALDALLLLAQRLVAALTSLIRYLDRWPA